MEHKRTWCFEKYHAVIQDTACVDDFHKTIEKRSLYKAQCEKTGEYQMYLADIFASNKEYKKARSLSEETIRKYGEKSNLKDAEKIIIICDIEENKIESARIRKNSR